MRTILLSLAVLSALILPNVGNAQAFQLRTPVPEVTAATANWQMSSEPIMVQGLVYLPTREIRLFDGQVMAQIGIYQGVPAYADTTLEPFSIVYVPLSRDRMRTYERRRERELAGTTGSRLPTYPVESPSVPPPEERIVATSGTIVPLAVSSSAELLPDRARPARTRVESIPQPGSRTTNGVWLEFNGARWYSDGAAVPFSPDRFTSIGSYRGFAVYRDKNSDVMRIWVSVVEGGPVAPYARQ